jgi:polyphosphate kinase
VAIKITLYRIGSNSPIVDRLIDAAERGKQVAVLIELKARFDERSNIDWATRPEDAGAHVVYGLANLKTHCKLCLVVRKEGDHFKRYMHIGTGNYNRTTAQLYTDLNLFTANEAIGADVSELFNYLIGYARQTEFRALLASQESAICSGCVRWSAGSWSIRASTRSKTAATGRFTSAAQT